MTAPGSAPGGPGDLEAGLARLAATARSGAPVLVALDFDGVLAPLQDDPERSRATPGAVAALRDLAPHVRLALVSGRALEDLAGKAEVPDGTLLVGSHGGERGVVQGGRLERKPADLTPGQAETLAHLRDELGAAVEGTTARLEHKPAAVVVHTRTATREDAERLTARAVEVGEAAGVDTMRGKDVVELSVLHVTKGDALADLRRETGAATLLYAGDDVTDERAFATLRDDDVTVKVGPGPTRARFRVASPDEVAGMLAALATALRTA